MCSPLLVLLAAYLLMGQATAARHLVEWDQNQGGRNYTDDNGPVFWLRKEAEAAGKQPEYNASAILPTADYALDDTVLSAYQGVGVQNYMCQQGQYKPFGAIATLYSAQSGERAGNHYFNELAKPVFVIDGYGYVAAELPPIQRIPSANSGSVDDLLLAVTAASEKLQERGWSYINRVLTTGGKAPPQCGADGAVISVPYTAKYLFYTKY